MPTVETVTFERRSAKKRGSTIIAAAARTFS
jgi:hypothetical protein